MGTWFFRKFSSPRRKFGTVCNSKKFFRLAAFHFFKIFYKFLFLVIRIDKKCFLRHGNVIFSKSFHLQGENLVLFVTRKSWKIPIFRLFGSQLFTFSKLFINFCFTVYRIDKKCFLRHGNVIFSKSFHLQGENSVLFVTRKSWKFPIFRLFRLATFHFLKFYFYKFLF